MTVEFLIYLGKASLSILLLMLLFKAALSADQTLVRNRFYLVGAIVWSVVVPILTMQQATSQGNLLPAVVISPTYTINIPELVVTPNSTSANGDWGSTCNIILTVYLTGVAIFLLKMVGSYIRVIYIIATAKNLAIDSYQIKVTRAAISPFAFFGWIVFPEKLIEHRDLTKMLIHERVHSRHWHSLDMLLGEIFTVFQWFNPASWMLKRLIVENHEYTADRAVVDLGIDTYEYQASLVNATVGREVVPVNHFSLILIKKRITMMNKKSSSAWLKVKSLLVPVAFVSVLALTSFTVEMGMNNITDEKRGEAVEATVPQQKKVAKENEVLLVAEVMPLFEGKEASIGFREYVGKNLKYPEAAMKKGKQGTVYVSFIVEKDGAVSNVKVIRGVSPELNQESIRIVSQAKGWTAGKQKGKPVRVSYTFPIKYQLDEDLKNVEIVKSSKGEDDAFLVVENMPKYAGKEASAGFREYVAKNLQYPEEAVKKGIEGKIYVSFIIEKDGTTSNVKILRGVNPLLDQEALRVVKNATSWTPGKQKGEAVSVSFVFPVMFKLDNETKEGEVKKPDAKVFVNGKEYTGEISAINPDDIKSITVLKGKSSTQKYGKKGEKGTLEITLKDGVPEPNLNTVTVTGYPSQK